MPTDIITALTRALLAPRHGGWFEENFPSPGNSGREDSFTASLCHRGLRGDIVEFMGLKFVIPIVVGIRESRGPKVTADCVLGPLVSS